MGLLLATTTSQQAWSSFTALFPALITLKHSHRLDIFISAGFFGVRAELGPAQASDSNLANDAANIQRGAAHKRLKVCFSIPMRPELHRPPLLFY